MTSNIGARLRAFASDRPWKRAVVFPESRDAQGRVAYTHLTFNQLHEESDAIGRGLRELGIERGTKTLLMVTPSLEFFALVFALFKIGAPPVLIDPGMGLSRLLECIRNVRPDALVGIGKAQIASRLFPLSFRSIRHRVTVGRALPFCGPTLERIKIYDDEPMDLAPTEADELAAILFTTGSTGPAKGVEYEHAMFDAQVDMLTAAFGVTGDDVDLPTFPLFALFSVALGMTAVVPDMNPTRPADVDPEKIIEAIRNQGCTFTFGSPALWNRVTAYCIENGVRFPSLRQVVMAGAPVPPKIHERFQSILGEHGETHTPYGATESLPVCDMTGREVLAETATQTRRGHGICIGRPVPRMTVEIIRIDDEPIPAWDDRLIVPSGEVGEIVVKGPTVTKQYHNNDRATALHKMADGDEIRHRIGDLGYRDDKGRIWFCGRKGHRVQTPQGLMLTICCEAVFNEHPNVARSALVGIGERPEQVPAIVVEPETMPAHAEERARMESELLALGAKNVATRDIKTVLFHPSFPVDIRHNAKINRESLTNWAAEQLRKRDRA